MAAVMAVSNNSRFSRNFEVPTIETIPATPTPPSYFPPSLTGGKPASLHPISTSKNLPLPSSIPAATYSNYLRPDGYRYDDYRDNWDEDLDEPQPTLKKVNLPPTSSKPSALKKTMSHGAISTLGGSETPSEIPRRNPDRHVHFLEPASPPKRTQSADAISSLGYGPTSVSFLRQMRQNTPLGMLGTAPLRPLTPLSPKTQKAQPTFNSNKSIGSQSSTSSVQSYTAPSESSKRNTSPKSNERLTTFRWVHGGNHVILTGEFDNWSSSIVMKRSSTNMATLEGRTEFMASIRLDRSRDWCFKFVVDGEWRCSFDFPTSKDNGGNVNNVIRALSEHELRNSSSPPLSPVLVTPGSTTLVNSAGVRIGRSPVFTPGQSKKGYPAFGRKSSFFMVDDDDERDDDIYDLEL